MLGFPECEVFDTPDSGPDPGLDLVLDLDPDLGWDRDPNLDPEWVWIRESRSRSGSKSGPGSGSRSGPGSRSRFGPGSEISETQHSENPTF